MEAAQSYYGCAELGMIQGKDDLDEGLGAGGRHFRELIGICP
jgi:hypothetical protein